MAKKFLKFVVLWVGAIAILLILHKIVTPTESGNVANCPLVETNFPPAALVNNSLRGELYLNGTWQFLPSDQKELPPNNADWGKILVPGNWQEKTTLSTAGVEAVGEGGVWQDYQGEKLGLAWYRRQIEVPADWQGRSILLDLTRISTDAVIYLNNLRCGEIPWAGGMVDITKVVEPGMKADLSILVAAVNSDADRQVIFGPNQVVTSSPRLDAKGLIGDVRLVSRPERSHLSDIFVQTSTRLKNVKLDIELTDISQAGSVQITAKMLDESGKVEQEFTSNLPVTKAEKQIISPTWAWANPRLWDVGMGNLYTLKLSVEGAGIKDEYDQSFGFREFWIAGKKFYLNGKELRLRPTLYEDQWQGWAIGVPEVIETLIASFSKAGFNIAQIWPWNHDIRGRQHFQGLAASIADRQGFPLIFPALDMTNYTDSRKWGDQKQPWEQKMLRELRGDRNHPSILMWGTSPNYFGHGDDQNPLRIGKKQVVGEVPKNWRKQSWQEAARIGEEAVRIIKSHDPTRPILVHQGASVGDVYALNAYLDMTPLQEREDWLRAWSQVGDQPFMVVEFGTPLHTTMMRGRNGFVDAIQSEPWMTEFAAIYLGTEAYQLETPAYRDRIKSQFLKGREYKNWQSNKDLDFAPAFQKLQALFSTNTWRSWRTYGITGGMLPWNDGHGWEVTEVGEKEVKKVKKVEGGKEGRGSYGEGEKKGVLEKKEGQKESMGSDRAGSWGVFMPQVRRKFWEPLQPPSYKVQPGGRAILANNAPTLAWIAGSPGFTAKDHNFWGGEKLQKQVVVINDTRQEQPFSFSWRVVISPQAVLERSRSAIPERSQVTVNQQNQVTIPERSRIVVATGENRGTIAPAKTQFFPLEVQLPTANSKQEGEIILEAQIGTSTPLSNPTSTPLSNPTSTSLTLTEKSRSDRLGKHYDRFPFRVFPRLATSNSPQITVQIFDPKGKTTAMLQELGYKTQPWDRHSPLRNSQNKTPESPALVVIGREALTPGQSLPENFKTYVQEGGRAIALIQKPEWYTNHGFRISPHLSRRIFPVDANHPAIAGLDQEDLWDWRGASTLTEAYPDTVKNPSRLSPHNSPWYGWHWGNGGAVSSVPLEKPHYSGWRSLLQSEFDLAYSPLMELDYGRGRLILSTLDLEDHFTQDPAAAQLARQVINYAAIAPLAPRQQQVVLVGEEGDTVGLENLGVKYGRAADLDKLDTQAGLQIVGARAKIPEAELQAYLQQGGKVLFLSPYPATGKAAKDNSLHSGSLGIAMQWQENFPGSLQIPLWAETRGLGIADFHNRTAMGSWVVKSGGEIGADGLLSRVKVGQGVAIFSGLNPEALFDPETPLDQQKTYLRFTRWRQTRAIAQILTNLGATFTSDELIWQPSTNTSGFWEQSWQKFTAKLHSLTSGSLHNSSFYHPDYWQDFNYGDDPYRYYRW